MPFAALSLAAATLFAPATAAAPEPTIPPVQGSTLAGEHVSLPADLRDPARSAVLILGFSKNARTPARDWGKRLAQDYFASPTVLYFEMPVLAGVPRFLRGAVLHSISAEVSDRGKHHFLPITADEARWRSLAGVTNPNAAYLLVVNSAGEVVFHTSAPLTDASYSDLRQHLPTAAPETSRTSPPVLP